MSLDLASDTMGSQRLRDSAIVQLVLALEKASVAAVKREISILGRVIDADGAESLAFDILDGISLGSWVDVIGAGSSEELGEGGGVGKGFVESCRDPTVPPASDAPLSCALRKFSKPLRLGTRKLYAIGPDAAGG